MTWELKEVAPKRMDGDEDFINYMHTFCKSVCESLEVAITCGDDKKIHYYRGILFAVKSLSQVYEDLIKGEYI